MLAILSQLINLIEQHTIWLYAACLVAILIYVRAYAIARRERSNTTFTIEKEIAVHREGRAMTGIGMMLGVVVVITAFKFYLMPAVDLSELVEPTPTFTLPIPTVPDPTVTPTEEAAQPAGPTAAPASAATVTPAVSPSPTAPPATPTVEARPVACADPNTSIFSPGMDATVSGSVALVGTATHPQFQFFKVECAIGADPSGWNVVGDLHHSPVVGGELARIDTRGLPNGPLWLQVTVVDQTGNFPPPCRVRVHVQN